MGRLIFSYPKLSLLVALVVLGAKLVGLQEFNQPLPNTRIPQAHGEPDYYLEGAKLTRFNAQGQRLQTIQSNQVTHYPEEDLAQFDKPLVHHYSEQGQVWRITALTAEYLEDQELYLENQVVITPLNPESAYTPEFFTEHLWVDTQAQTANTPDPVSFVSPGGTSLGKGFALDMNTGQAEIQQEAQGYYLPPAKVQDTQ